ncbi:hypothetical protein [Reyranella sp.]|jgi:hypothetical protein|uniref:hypothetical protein n=1 Tax=Reyranella sp. TaxID=1929291 RepID=UPI002F941987
MSPLQSIPQDRAAFDDVSPLIGGLVVNLALFELALNAVVGTIYHRLDGERIERDIPVSLTKRLAFAAKAARRLPDLASERAVLLAIVEEATRLSSLRHDIVNGYLAEYDAAGLRPMRFARMRTDRGTRRTEEITLRRITTDDLARASDDAIELASRTALLSKRLLAEPPAGDGGAIALS